MKLSENLAWELKTLNFKNGLGRIRTTRYINGLFFEKSEPETFVLEVVENV